MSKRKTNYIETEAAEELVETVEAVEPETVCYMGITVPGRIQRGQFFRGGLPDWAERLVSQCPAIGGLMIPVSQLPYIKTLPIAVLNQQVAKWAERR